MTLESNGDLTDGLDLPGESVVDTNSSVFDFDFDGDEDEEELRGQEDEPMKVDESAGGVVGEQSVGEDDGSKPPKKAILPASFSLVPTSLILMLSVCCTETNPWRLSCSCQCSTDGLGKATDGGFCSDEEEVGG